MLKKLFKNTLCRLGFHYYKTANRGGEVNWVWIEFTVKRCINCGKEKNRF